MAASDFHTNPRGGGGNQYIPLFLLRQGDYGYHTTFTGKIVHRRKRHYFNTNDLMRIIPKVAVEEEKKEDFNEGFYWWEKVLNAVAEYMLAKITAWGFLGEGVPRIAWSWINKIYFAFLEKITKDAYFERLHVLYRNRLEYAVDQYTMTGSHKGIEDLFKRLDK